MAKLSDLPLKYRTMMAVYPWRKLNPVPCASLGKPLSEARVAIVSSGALVPPDQDPFDDTIKGGDWSYRVLAADMDVQTLIETHRSDAFDHSGVAADKNMGLPLERLREMVGDGEIGSLAPRHISLMGSITAPGRLVKQTLPEVTQLLRDDGVDAVLLVPL